MAGRSSIPPVASPPTAVRATAEPLARRPVLDRVEASAPPVFVHSSWRTSSTWLWPKLRQAPTAIAYCEIFHELLDALTMDHMRGNDFAKWDSKHPEGAPYFLEFAQLIEPGGACGATTASMAFDRFIPQDGLAGSLSAAEKAYVEGLIENAYARRKIPVLTDTRTLGRVKALADAFPGRHVLLVRNAFHQWGSYTEQWAHGNNYFLSMLFKTIDGSRHDPFVKLLSDWFADEDRSPNSAPTFQLFLLFHLYLYAHAFDATDLVVDVNRIAAEPEHRAAIEQALSEYVCSPVDLSDVQRAVRPVAVFRSFKSRVRRRDRPVRQANDRRLDQRGSRVVRDPRQGRGPGGMGKARVLQPDLPGYFPSAAEARRAGGRGSDSVVRPRLAAADRSTDGSSPASAPARSAEPKSKRGRPRAAAAKPQLRTSKVKRARRPGAPKRNR